MNFQSLICSYDEFVKFYVFCFFVTANLFSACARYVN